MENHIDTFLKTRDRNILHSKFYIDMKLNVASAKKLETDNVAVATNSSNPDIANALLEEGELGLESFTGSNVDLTGNRVSPKRNTTMAVNALQLAILAKQSVAVKCIMNHIFLNEIWDEKQFSETLYAVLGAHVLLDFHGLDPDLFSNYDRYLDRMNALHLSCQYHPEAIEIMFDTIHKHNVIRTNLLSLVNAKTNVMAYAPLHIAAKKSLTNVAR